MKNFTLLAFFLFSVSAFADIEAMPGDETKPSAVEIVASRSCFDEVLTAGCRHPKKDQTEFQSFMSNIYESLTPSCKKMMSQLYGK
jgi:hypothetical protein